MQVSVSKMKKWRRCPNAYRYKYVEGITPKAKSVPLERGSWVHALLETHYEGGDWKKAHKKLKKKFNGYFEEVREDLGHDLPDVCKDIMRRYLIKYPDDFDRFTVVDTELDEIVTLPNGLELRLIIDVVLEDKTTGNLWLRDYKTRKKFQSSNQHMLDPQLTLYHYGAELLGYKPLAGVVIDEILTKPPTLPKVLQSGELEKRKNIFCDHVSYLDEIKKHELDPRKYSEMLAHLAVVHSETFFRRTEMPKDPPMIKTMVKEAMYTAEEMMRAEKKGQFPRTYNANQCQWDCEYRDVCLIELTGGDPSEMIKRSFETREQKKKRERREKLAGEVKRLGKE